MRVQGLDREIMSIIGLHDRVDAVHEDKARKVVGRVCRQADRQA
jgi:hypothetical protein